jgi:DNA-binding Lrp family transcriptional regulator
MATRAYVLIKVRAGKTKAVVESLRKISGIEQVHPCFGQPDIFSFVSVGDERALSEVVITKIHTIEGVEETDTHIVADT